MPLRAARGSRVLVALLLLAACGSPAATPPPTATPVTRSPVASSPAAAVPACPAARRPAAGQRLLSFRGRDYVREVSPAVTWRRPVLLVLALHGYRERASFFAGYTGLGTAAAHQQVVVVTPQGLGGARSTWNFARTPRRADDVAFLRALVSHVRSQVCVGRVVAAGYSDGADMAGTLHCTTPGLLSGLALVAPAPLPPSRCPAAVPVVYVHGTADPIEPYAGGDVDPRYGFEGIRSRAAVDHVAFWRRVDRCTAAPRSVAFRAHVRRTSYSSCRAGSEVVFYSVTGGGHAWPGAADRPRVGPTNREMSLSAELLRFFAAHP